MTYIVRDGKTLDLEHDASDRLTTVENETTGSTIQYAYDGQGRRVAATEGSSQRRFLVAPAMGGGLESTDLISDANGNLISNYVYAGGSSPFMRLDASGNPIYYLTDAMGSTIGLADGTGKSAAKFNYDSFGNLRSSSGVAASGGVAGGDFRFQGQWLEQGTGIYNFRARDYDAKTGMFLSRDPVDIIETEPESFNPYQFVYHNPHVYTDPSGETTISEIQATQIVQDVLQQIRAEIGYQVRQYVTDQARAVVGNLVKSTIARFVPFEDNIIQYISQMDEVGNQFEDFLTKSVCGLIGESYRNYLDALWIEPKVATSGDPQTDGFSCDDANTDLEGVRTRASLGPRFPRFDFIVKQGGPASTDYVRTRGRGEKAWLSGDFKARVNTAYEKARKKDPQWIAMINYAKRENQHQYAPIALYLTFFGGKSSNIKYIQKEAAKEGVFVDVINIIPWLGR